ncbi:MAG: choice-of-anchor J domain-containing protein [Bacteroidales bacterium]|nr:choice-of-anchor J domain-containing protein [Bacteroidales bacterium]
MKKAFLILLTLVLSVSVMAQQKIQLRSADKAECTRSDMTSLQASFSFSTIEAQDYESERGTFSWLSLPNTVIGGNEGDPQIPVVNELIAVPFGANPRIEITSYSTTDYRLEDYGMKTLVPRQPSLRKDKNPEEVPFVYNASAYQSTRGFRGEPKATVNVMGTMRGVQLGKMTIEPVSYDPVNNTMRVFNDIEVTVHFEGADAVATEKMLVDTYSPYFDIVYKQLFNERAVRDAYSDHPDLYNTPVKMLVVATSAYQSSTAFQNWLTWKKQKGIDVDIYTVTSSTTSSTIQTEIYNRYNANHPTFLVIVGDETVVKPFKTNWSCGSTYGNCVNDLEYASVDGDVYHDMFMSRMSVSSTTELGNLVNKILTYEKYTMSDPTYLNNSLLVAGWDSNWTSRVGKPTIQYANNNYYNSAHGINPTVYITTASGQTAAWNNINNVGFVNYTAHGDIQELADPEFTNSNANSMTNNDKYLWIVANCCLTANWGNSSYYPCLGETMIRAANKGAFGYIGSIPESYWYEDYYFGVGAFSYVAGTVQTTSSTTTGMYDAAFDDTGFNTLNSMPYIGNVAVTYAHAAGYTSSVTDEYYWRAYQCLGDGSVMPYLNNPSANSVSHASTINIGATTFQVNAHAGSYVAITKNNEILGVAQADASGVANVPISGLTSAGDVMIVVTRNQRQPYITTIQAVAVNGPYITLDSYTPNMALIGQSTNLSLTFKNVGNAATSGNTTVTLTGDSNVTIGTGTKTFSSLAVDASTTVSGFSFTIKPNVTVGSNVTLHYTAVNGSNTWEGDLTVTANQVYTVSVASNNTNYGTVSGGGQYNYNQSCTVTATPADGYMFTNWTSNGSVVSTDASYTFNVTANVDLVANFAAGVMIGSGTETNDYLPSYNYYNYSLTEQIYTSAELGGAGVITSIAFYNGGAAKTRTYDFYLKTTTKSNFSSKTDWITVSSSDKVFSGSVTMAANAWTTVTFSTPFEYDGSSNLVLVADDNTGSYTSSPHMSCRVFTASNQAIYTYDDNTNFNPLSPSAGSYNALLSVKNQLIVTKEPISTEPVSITVSANPTNGGSVTGAGTYDIGSSVTLTATANTGYTFTNWTKNGVEVSTSATYSFNASATNSGAYVANFTLNSYTVSIAPNPIEGGTVAFASKEGGEELTYDFEDGWQGWTTFQGNTTSPNSWMHNTDYPTTNNDFTTGYGYNNSNGFMLSESYISGTSSGSGTAVTPDNYLVSPQVRLGGSISFYAGARNTSYCAEKFSVMVSTTGNTNADSFTTVGTWTLSLSEVGYNSTPYTVDLSAYSGMGYIAIRHFDCYDQWFLAVDNITIVEGTIDDGSASGTFNYGTSCTVTATPNANYHFVNWTENGMAVSTEASYTFTVTSGRDLVANFSAQQPSLVGDVNEDGVVSIDDVSVLLSHVLGNISLTDQALINADVNGDGVVSIDDVSTLLYMSMNK